jgi:membrane associated rhomboid family serine protease
MYNNSQSNSFLNSITPVTRNLLIINLLVWLMCYLTKGDLVLINGSLIRLPSKVADIFGLYDLRNGDFHIYQLITYMFTHDEFWHLFTNMFALFMFGSTLENHWGQKRFLTYYVVTGIGAGLVQLLICYIGNLNSVTIGASGAVFGILLAFGMTFPNVSLFIIPIPFPIKAKYFVAGYGLLEFFFGISNRAGDNVAHFAHLGGMLFGVLLILYWRWSYRNGWGKPTFFKKITGVFKNKSSRMNVKYKRPETDMEYNARKNQENKEIDSILEKIKHSGYNSLSEKEKKKLFDAGKK